MVLEILVLSTSNLKIFVSLNKSLKLSNSLNEREREREMLNQSRSTRASLREDALASTRFKKANYEEAWPDVEGADEDGTQIGCLTFFIPTLRVCVYLGIKFDQTE